MPPTTTIQVTKEGDSLFGKVFKLIKEEAEEFVVEVETLAGPLYHAVIPKSHGSAAHINAPTPPKELAPVEPVALEASEAVTNIKPAPAASETPETVPAANTPPPAPENESNPGTPSTEGTPSVDNPPAAQ